MKQCIKINKYQIAAMMSAILWGIVSHGYIVANKISYHDDNRFYFSVGATFESGRWFLGIVQKGMNKLGLFHYSQPWWNGIITILLAALCVVILADLFRITHYRYAVLLGALFISFPAMASLFSYMFAAPYYMFAVLLIILAVYIAVKYRYGFAFSAVLIGFSMGIYQAYFGVATALFVLILIAGAEEKTFLDNLKTAFLYLFTLIAGLLFYFAGMKVCLFLFDVTLLDYQGISDMANVTVKSLLLSVKNAYKGFLQPMRADLCGISNHLLSRFLYWMIYAVSAVLLVKKLIVWKTDLWNKIYLFGLYCLVPLSIGIIYVMAVSDKTVVHTLMIYPFLFGIFYPIVLLEREKIYQKAVKAVSIVYCVSAALLSCYFARLDNTAYLKASYQQEAAVSYYTDMISKIKNTEGYASNLPVLVYGVAGWKDASVPNLWQFSDITLQGYNNNMEEFLSYYTGKSFMEIHCGYTYTEPENRDVIINSEPFLGMPSYPDSGSIQIIDGTVVVKLSDFELPQ